MDFDTFIETAWADHAADPRAVALRMSDAAVLAADEAQLVRLANLAHHVHGEHLADWRAGIAFMQQLASLPAFAAEGESGHTLRRCTASLTVCDSAADDAPGLSPSDRIRVAAMAAGNLAERDTPRAMRLFQQALAQAEHSGLGAADPMNRALAVAGNQLACTLEEKSLRSALERELMLIAAQAARRYWALAGTWLEVERAEYRLAMSWLQAGEVDRARVHAQACLDIVGANQGAALERFFGWEALSQVELAAANDADHAQALAQARHAFAELDDADKAWCATSLDKLAA